MAVTKKCRVCGETKPLGEFYSHPNTRDGRAGICKACQRAYVQSRYNRKRPVYPAGQKVCPRCKRVLSLESFAKNAARSDGHQAYCLECWPEYQQEWRRKPGTLSATNAWQRLMRQTPEGRRMLRIRRLTNDAIQLGILVREPCEVCGDANVQAHHTDYSKPLQVRWLCKLHHKTHGHGGSFTNPPQ